MKINVKHSKKPVMVGRGTEPIAATRDPDGPSGRLAGL